MNVKIVIIGAGPTGLSAAYRLQELGIKDFVILEKASHVGGLSTTFRDPKGFLWDIGGHVQFSHYQYFDSLMNRALGSTGWLHHQRESWVWIKERFISYPFQNNIRNLPKDDLSKCLYELIDLYQRPTAKQPKNFSEWLEIKFGRGLCEVFMNPYNRKVWAYPLEEMSYQWVGERVAQADLKRIIHNLIYEEDDRSWGPNSTFQFPLHGGTGAIWEGVANLIIKENIQLNTEVESITPVDKKVHLVGGGEIGYELLLNTAPIDQLIDKIIELPEVVRVEAAKMKFSSSNIVGIGIDGAPPKELSTKCWIYFSEDNCPFYRVTVFSNYSPNNVPDPGKQWSVMAEVSESPVKKVDQDQLIENVTQGLRSTRVLPENAKILSKWQYRAEYGYPTPFLGRDEVLKKLHGTLEALSIFSRGRFGGWKYEVSNQDHASMQGVEWANRVILNVPETTYHFPETANANWGRNL